MRNGVSICPDIPLEARRCGAGRDATAPRYPVIGKDRVPIQYERKPEGDCEIAAFDAIEGRTGMNDTVDVLIIGAGASGAAVAWSLAETKMHILCLEQGGWMNPATYPSTGRDWEARFFGDYSPSPNIRARPEDYPINDDNSPIKGFMRQFLSSAIASKDNKWQPSNATRWHSEAYDNLDICTEELLKHCGCGLFTALSSLLSRYRYCPVWANSR
jgi:hypothetical protein